MMFVMTCKIRWPDGSTTIGATPDDVLRKIGEAQWEPTDPERMARLLSDRAFAWSGRLVDETQPVDVLMRQLADAGMFEIVEWEPGPS